MGQITGSIFVVRRGRVRGRPAEGAADLSSAVRAAAVADARRNGLLDGGPDHQQEGHRQDYQVPIGVGWVGGACGSDDQVDVCRRLHLRLLSPAVRECALTLTIVVDGIHWWTRSDGPVAATAALAPRCTAVTLSAALSSPLHCRCHCTTLSWPAYYPVTTVRGRCCTVLSRPPRHYLSITTTCI